MVSKRHAHEGHPGQEVEGVASHNIDQDEAKVKARYIPTAIWQWRWISRAHPQLWQVTLVSEVYTIQQTKELPSG